MYLSWHSGAQLASLRHVPLRDTQAFSVQFCQWHCASTNDFTLLSPLVSLTFLVTNRSPNIQRSSLPSTSRKSFPKRMPNHHQHHQYHEHQCIPNAVNSGSGQRCWRFEPRRCPFWVPRKDDDVGLRPNGSQVGAQTYRSSHGMSRNERSQNGCPLIMNIIN